MPGETDLAALLNSMSPRLIEGEFVFCTVEDPTTYEFAVPPILSFFEKEGIALILERTEAEAHGLDFTYPSRMITLDVRSSLEAVGFLAAITTRLAAEGMSVNAVSAYHHDHLFVPADRAVQAMQVLRALCATGAG